MSKLDLKGVLRQLSNDNLNLVVNNVIAGSDSGSYWTISDNGSGWSISDLWDSSNPSECSNPCHKQ